MQVNVGKINSQKEKWNLIIGNLALKQVTFLFHLPRIWELFKLCTLNSILKHIRCNIIDNAMEQVCFCGQHIFLIFTFSYLEYLF